MLRRFLEFRGLEVRYVSNITDIDDNIITRASEEGRSEAEVAAQYEAVWWDAMDALGVKRPTEIPHATAFVADMVALIGALVDRGVAYETSDGVYLSVDRDRRLRAAGPPEPRFAAGRGPGGARRGEALPPGLRAVEEGPARRAHLGLAVGPGSTGLAHRVRGDVARPPR